MKLFFATCAISLVLGFGGAAQTLTGTIHDDSAMLPSGTQLSQDSATNILTRSEGQFVYDMDGNEIGRISALHTNAGGQEGAVVETEQPLGIGTRQVLIPSTSLQPKAEGGFVTSLSRAAIAALPDYLQQTSGVAL